MEIAVAVDIFKASHLKGFEKAKEGAVNSGCISIIRNIVAVIKKEKDVEEALSDVAHDTGSAVIESYSKALTRSVIKGFMINSSSEFTKSLSKTKIPGMIANIAINAGQTIAEYIRGEIDGVECFEELGEKGTGILSSAMFAILFQMAIPIPLVGGLIGSTIGYALSCASYNELITALRDAKLAEENRIQIEAECEEAIRLIIQYRTELEANISENLSEHITTFHIALDEIQTSLGIGDIDRLITGANTITYKLGGKPQFENYSQFEVLIESQEKILL
jgi:hypothetical protein